MIRASDLDHDDPRRHLIGLVFGAPERTHRGPEDFPIKIDLDATLELTSPVFPPMFERFPSLVEKTREALIAGSAKGPLGGDLADEARSLGRLISRNVARYAEFRDDGSDHLYVLEFQGPKQYIKFGRTRNISRRVSDHLRPAHLHGYALLNGWASPGVEDAGMLEWPALLAAEWMHGMSNERERFFDMPYRQALSIARAAYELRHG